MDATIQYYLDLIQTEKREWKKKKYIRQLKNEVYAYRSTAYLNRGKNVASICNRFANQIEHELKEVVHAEKV
jgi:hypothetical protein